MTSDLILTSMLGIATSAATAFITAKLQLRRESALWRREFAVKFAEVSAKPDKTHAQALAQQLGIGVIIFDDPQNGRQKHFVPPGCRLVVGRNPACDILVNDGQLSRQHFAVFADDASVYVEDLGSGNGVSVNGRRVTGRRKLASGELIQAGSATFEFWRLDSPA